jgi:hypothetical protein
MKKYLWVSFIVYLTLFAFSCKKSSDSGDNSNNPSHDTVSYSGNLMKSDTNVVTSATGTVSAVFHPGNNELDYTFTWQGLTGKALEMHIHDGGAIIIPINGFPMEASGTYSGKATLTSTQATDLQAGKLYGQIHTQQYPAGEVLGVLTTGSQSTPPPPPPPPTPPY